MNTLQHTPLSAPAQRVKPAQAAPFTAERFSRTLDERNPYTRSSTAVIVPMGDAPMHPAEKLVLRASLFCGAALLLALLVERYLP